jgi:hypothetical protein
MLFRDLLDLPFNSRTNRIDEASLARALPSTPPLVLHDLYADHGRNSDFQTAYGGVDIGALGWKLSTIAADKLTVASINPKFRPWFEMVKSRTAAVTASNWNPIDSRPEVVSHWETHRTWKSPPIFLGPGILPADAQLRLIEGHTRLAVLAQLVASGLVATSSVHEGWVGS